MEASLGVCLHLGALQLRADLSRRVDVLVRNLYSIGWVRDQDVAFVEGQEVVIQILRCLKLIVRILNVDIRHRGLRAHRRSLFMLLLSNILAITYAISDSRPVE